MPVPGPPKFGVLRTLKNSPRISKLVPSRDRELLEERCVDQRMNPLPDFDDGAVGLRGVSEPLLIGGRWGVRVAGRGQELLTATSAPLVFS